MRQIALLSVHHDDGGLIGPIAMLLPNNGDCLMTYREAQDYIARNAPVQTIIDEHGDNALWETLDDMGIESMYGDESHVSDLNPSDLNLIEWDAHFLHLDFVIEFNHDDGEVEQIHVPIRLDCELINLIGE